MGSAAQTMNTLETWFCGSGVWRWVTRKQLLPWILNGTELGDHLLELGAGPGAATEELRKRATQVTSLEYDYASAARLHARTHGANGNVIRGDAAALPFPEGTFSSAIAILMLHHMRSKELQDRAFAEISRVLRPNGVFLAFEIPDGWWHRVEHIKSTFVPLEPAQLNSRLRAAGFSHIDVNQKRGGIRIRALRAENQ